MASDTMHPRASALPSLDWQSELDSAMADLDSRLTHPRRRATDSQRQPVLPELGQVRVTTELLDEIAWRVAEQLRRTEGGMPATASKVLAALETPQPAAAPPPPPPAPQPPTPLPPAARIPPLQEATTVRPAAREIPTLPREADRSGLAPGKVLLVRFQVPDLPWPFRPLRRRP